MVKLRRQVKYASGESDGSTEDDYQCKSGQLSWEKAKTAVKDITQR